MTGLLFCSSSPHVRLDSMNRDETSSRFAGRVVGGDPVHEPTCSVVRIHSGCFGITGHERFLRSDFFCYPRMYLAGIQIAE